MKKKRRVSTFTAPHFQELGECLKSVFCNPNFKIKKCRSIFVRQTALACLDGICDEANSKKVQDLNINVQKELVIEDGLMERYFGRLDDAEIHTYAYVRNSLLCL